MSQPGWWTDAVIYQVYPRSFADGDGDGVGDLPGITARLGHIAELGVDAVWLSPFYPSPQRDGGYDVADYRDVDPRFGTLADADALLARARELGLRVILDLVPNHTSSEHRWFRAALAAEPGSPERERYVFRDGRGPQGAEPPNHWPSVFGGSAWSRVTEPDGRAGQWYLHLFDTSQPDLNWENPEVRAEFEDVLRFWLDRGVSGFRVDVAHGLIKAPGLPDWNHPHTPMCLPAADGSRPPMWDQDAVHDVHRSWRKLTDSYGGERILVAEAWVGPPQRLARYVRSDEMHQAFNFLYLTAPWRAGPLREVVTESLASCRAVGAAPTWVLSNHDVVRHASRLGYPDGLVPTGAVGAADPQPDRELGLRRARAATLLMLALPGSAYVYQGEELGLPEHSTLPDEARRDPTYMRTGGAQLGRDGARVPLPWQADAPAFGFSPSGLSWLPQPADWAGYALDRQRGVAGSTYELYRSALRLRGQYRLGAGDLQWTTGARGLPTGDDVIAFSNGAVLVVANLGAAPVALPAAAHQLLSSEATAADESQPGVVPGDTTVWAVLRD